MIFSWFSLICLTRLVYPVRVGEHSNSAFGLAMALDYTRLVSSVQVGGAWERFEITNNICQISFDRTSAVEITNNICQISLNRTSAVADSMTEYLGNLEAAIVTSSTNFYGENHIEIKTFRNFEILKFSHCHQLDQLLR